MLKSKNLKMIVGVFLTFTLFLSIFVDPLRNVFAYNSDGAQELKRGSYYDLPQTIENYLESGKTLEFDLNILVPASDVRRMRICDGTTQVSSDFFLRDGEEGISVTIDSIGDGWYHYTIPFATIPHSDSHKNRKATRIRAVTLYPDGTLINNIKIGIDVMSLPEAFTEDVDTVTLADLGLAGTDYQTPVLSGTYSYKGKSETKSVVVSLGWEANITDDIDWKLALDEYWNSNCMIWFRPEKIYFCPGDGANKPINLTTDSVTSGRHSLEFGRLRVVAGPNTGKDYVFLKIDGEVKVKVYTKYYQTAGGYISHGDKVFSPSYTVCFVNEGVSKQGLSGFALPDQYVSDIDYINLGDVVPGGVVKDTVHDGYLGYTYPVSTMTSNTHSTVVKYLLKTGQLKEGLLDGSVMVVDIGGNCGYCRAYIPSGKKSNIMFGWEIDGCESGTKKFTFESNTWYAFEQGRLRVTSGANKGKDYVYLKIDGQIVSAFYGNPESRPCLGEQIYVEATEAFQIVGYNEIRAKYYIDDELYLDQLAQKGYNVKKPADPKKTGSYFVGWYTAKSGGSLFDFKNTKPTSNVSLYGRFTEEKIKVTYNAANGSPANSVDSGKGCLVAAPKDPSYSDGQYEYVFTGWKNEATGKIFDFSTDRPTENITLTAQYKEKEYYVSYYANGTLVKKVPFVLSNPTVSGKEPSVPSVPKATGKWENHKVEGLTKNMTVNAVYTVTPPSSTSAIKLDTYAGNKIYLNTDIIHEYLSTETSKQSDYIREYIASAHKYQDYQKTTFKWTDSGSNSKYTVYFADNKEFKNAYIVTTTKKSLVNEVGIFVPGKTYYWYVCGNNTGKCSAVDNFKIVNTPIRYITAGSVINMRDLGGQVNGDGNRVKYELVYRGAALDEYTSHIDDSARNIFNYLGMNSEIELRGGYDHDYTGWDENDPDVYYIVGANYQPILTLDNSQKAQYKATFEAMADKKNYPFYFHCSAGADRTGTFAYLLYGLLGVSYDDIRPEYELTSFSAIGRRTADLYSGDYSLDTTNRLMLEQYGDGSGNLQTAVCNFLKTYVGISNDTIEAIREIMLDNSTKQNEKPNTITVKALGKTYTYYAFDGVYFMPDPISAPGKIFKGYYNGNTKYNGYANKDITLTAKFEDMSFEPYDTLSLKDLGVKDNKIKNNTNTVYTYNKTAKSGGRLVQFILEPIGDMNGGDGPQVALTNDWAKNSYARVWFQTNELTHVYYSGVLGSGPDISKMISLESGKQYNIEYSVRVLKNSGYEGKKVFEVTVNGELLIQYIGCKADLSGNTMYFHGGTGSAYLINDPVYKTVRFYNGSTLIGTYKVERSGLLPKVKEPGPKSGVPFAGWYTANTGGKLWDENADIVYNDMSLYAHFAHVKVITADVDGKLLTYRVEVGKTLDSIPRPQKSGNVFMGWLYNGRLFTGTVSSNMTVKAAFEEYSFDDYDEISLRDLGIYTDLDFAIFGDRHTRGYNYYKAAKTGGRVFKAIYIPTTNMINGPQVSFSTKWDENYYSKLYFTKYDKLYVYSSGIDGGLPTLNLDTELIGGKEYYFEIGVRVLNNKGYKGVKVLTVYINGELIFEEFDNRSNLADDIVFFQGLPDTGIFRNIDIYKTASFYRGGTLVSSQRVLRGSTIKSPGRLSDMGDMLFTDWLTEYGQEWDFATDALYLDTVFKAKYQKRTYPVSLIVDGVLYKRLNISAGESADISDVPEKDGYEFDKWTLEDGGDYDMQSPVNAPVTLVANFKKLSSKGMLPIIKKDAESTDSSYLKYIIFALIGLLVAGAEVGLIFVLKRSKK